MPTGPGHLDPEGVWLFGEADENPLTSDLLNRGMTSVSTQLGLVRADLTNLADLPDTGSFPIMASTTPTVPTGRTKFSTNWAGINNTIWQGVQHRRRAEMVYISGACTRSGGTAPALETIAIMPAGLRPAGTTPGMAWTSSGAAYVLIAPTGEIQSAVPVSGQLTLQLAFIAA